MAEIVIAEERAGDGVVRWCFGQYLAVVDRRFAPVSMSTPM